MTENEVTKVQAAGGVVYRCSKTDDEPEVLLIFRNKVWDLPKGKLEEDETIEMCAVREVAEETGSHLPAIVRELGTTFHTYQENGEAVEKTTFWYSMIFTKTEHLKPQTEEGIEDIEWVPLSEAIEKAGYENLKNILKKLKA